jgi:hypothetical protein
LAPFKKTFYVKFNVDMNRKKKEKRFQTWPYQTVKKPAVGPHNGQKMRKSIEKPREGLRRK